MGSVEWEVSNVGEVEWKWCRVWEVLSGGCRVAGGRRRRKYCRYGRRGQSILTV